MAYQQRRFDTHNTQSKFTRVKILNEEQDGEYTLRVSAKRSPGVYIVLAARMLLQDKAKCVTLKAIQGAIPTVMKVSYILANRIAGLHQVAEITNTSFTEEWEPLEEGLVKIEITRTLSLFKLHLTLEPTEEQRHAPGYQAPLPDVTGRSFEDIARFTTRGAEGGRPGEGRGDDNYQRRPFRGRPGGYSGAPRERQYNDNDDRRDNRGRGRQYDREDFDDNRRNADRDYDRRRPPRGDRFDDREDRPRRAPRDAEYRGDDEKGYSNDRPPREYRDRPRNYDDRDGERPRRNYDREDRNADRPRRPEREPRRDDDGNEERGRPRQYERRPYDGDRRRDNDRPRDFDNRN